MGCGSSQPELGSLGEQYAAAQLMQPYSSEFENEFEKQIFYAINLCRYDPKRFVVPVKEVAASHTLAKGKDTKDLILFLQKCERLTQVRFDDQANAAARKNNVTIIEKNEDVPTQGGNIEVYNSIVGSDKSTVCEEYTMCQFEGQSAQEFIALQLILDWNREGEAGKNSPILNKDTTKVGISNKAHKKTKNLIQVLYVKMTVNALD